VAVRDKKVKMRGDGQRRGKKKEEEAIKRKGH